MTISVWGAFVFIPFILNGWRKIAITPTMPSFMVVGEIA
jgi:hypothetical protein